MVLAQVVGLIGILLLIAIFQVNDRRMILRLQILSCLVWALYYAMMGAYTAMGLIGIGILRSYLFDRYRSLEWLLPMTIAVYAIATLVTWHDWTSIMAFVGITLATIAIWQKHPRSIRSVSLTVTPFWLTYNYLNGSFLGIVGDLVTFTSVAIGVWRFDILPYLRNRSKRTNTPDIVDANLL